MALCILGILSSDAMCTRLFSLYISSTLRSVWFATVTLLRPEDIRALTLTVVGEFRWTELVSCGCLLLVVSSIEGSCWTLSMPLFSKRTLFLGLAVASSVKSPLVLSLPVSSFSIMISLSMLLIPPTIEGAKFTLYEKFLLFLLEPWDLSFFANSIILCFGDSPCKGVSPSLLLLRTSERSVAMVFDWFLINLFNAALLGESVIFLIWFKSTCILCSKF